jgi:hypothetical protein
VRQATTIAEMAKRMAYSLGMPVYIRGDRIFQDPPGEKVEPGPGAKPVPLGAPSMGSKTE